MAHYIGGDRQLPNGRDRIAVVNAATEKAFAWSARSLPERVGYLKKAAEKTKSIQLLQDFASRLTSEPS